MMLTRIPSDAVSISRPEEVVKTYWKPYSLFRIHESCRQTDGQEAFLRLVMSLKAQELLLKVDIK